MELDCRVLDQGCGDPTDLIRLATGVVTPVRGVGVVLTLPSQNQVEQMGRLTEARLYL